MRAGKPSVLGMINSLGPQGLATLTGLGPFNTLWRYLGRHFSDPRLRQLFARYATYCGASPWQAPATLMLVAQVEMDGVWAVEGGMHAVAQSFARLAAQRGATLRYGTACEQILLNKAGHVRGVQLAGGEELPADAVVFNGSPQALVDGLLGAAVQHAVPSMPVKRRSLSAVTWALHTPTAGFELERHNVFFDERLPLGIRRHLPTPPPARRRHRLRLRARPRRRSAGACRRARAPAVPGERTGRRRPPPL